MVFEDNFLDWPKKLSSNTIFRLHTFRKFYIAKINYFCERPYKVKGFEMFLIDHHAGAIGNKTITGKYEKILVPVSPTLY